MANPTSKGVGTGTAVVTDYTGLNNTTANFFKGLNTARTAEDLKKEKAAEKREKAEAELEGKLGDYDPSKVKEGDRELLMKQYNAIKAKYAGRYGEILQGDPALANEFYSDMGMLKNFTYNSADSKEKFRKQYDVMIAPGSGFSEDKFQKAKEYMMSAGSTEEGAKELGLFTPDTIVGDPLERMDGLLGDENKIFEIKKGSYENKNRQIVKYDKKNWLPDEKAKPKFFAAISTNPRMMQDLNLMYPIDGENIKSHEDQMEAFYIKYKEVRDETLNEVNIGRTPSDSDDDGGEFGDKRDKFNFAIRDSGDAFITDPLSTTKDSDVITISKKSGSPLSPITVNGTVGVISEIKRDDKGNFVMVRNITKDDLDGNVIVTGETVVDPINGTVEAHLESEYGIKDLESFSKELKNRNTSTGGATKEKAQALIEKYKK